MPYDVYLFPSAINPKDVILRPSLLAPQIYKHNIFTQKRYIKAFTQIKRNGVVIDYCTPYIKFEDEKAIQT
jgi:hypothetical protein